DIMIAECRCILRIEACEMHAVESRQTEARAAPQITIGCLSNRAYEVVRQTFVSLPHAGGVFGERTFRSFGCRRSWRVLSHARQDDEKQHGCGHQNRRCAAKLSHERQ